MVCCEGVVPLNGDRQLTPPPSHLSYRANNHYRCNEFMDILQKRLDAQLNEKHRAECSKHLSATRDGFMKVAKTGYQLLIDSKNRGSS